MHAWQRDIVSPDLVSSLSMRVKLLSVDALLALPCNLQHIRSTISLFMTTALDLHQSRASGVAAVLSLDGSTCRAQESMLLVYGENRGCPKRRTGGRRES